MGISIYLITAEDRVKQVEKSVVSLTIQDQKYMLETFIDVTQHKQDEDILKRYNLILENALDPILFIRCKDGKIIEANRAVIKTYGYDREEILSMSIFDLRDNDTKFRIENQMAKADNQGILFETVHRKKDGTTFPVEVSSSGTDLGGERVLVSIIRDISERQEHEAQLTYMANHDHLTGLPNRRLLEHSLTRAISRGRRGKKSALMFMDLDNFKYVNDNFGHAAGDQVLITISNVVREYLRDEDLLIRLGGDEFAVLLDSSSIDDVLRISERLRKAVEKKKFFMNGESFNLSFSIGVVIIDGKLNPGILMSRADAAMYMAKENGKNRVIIYSDNDAS